MRHVLCFLLVLSGCALRVPPAIESPPPVVAAPDAGVAPFAAAPAAAVKPAAVETASESVEADEAEEADDAPVAEEGESREGVASAEAEGLRYTADLSDAELADHWSTAPESLGSIALGFADEGRLVNGVQFPPGEGWVVVSPRRAYATQETIDYVIAAIRKVREAHPDAPPLRVNQLSLPEGGYARPHKSHQNGRDVDLGFYYPTVHPVVVREREKVIDVALNWALVKALVTETDVQFILVDRRVQKVLYAHALAAGEDKAWLDSLFRAGRGSILQHARKHRDHFHVRFYNPRAQELGRPGRAAPRAAARAEHRDAPGALGRHAGSDRPEVRQHGSCDSESQPAARQLLAALAGVEGPASGALHEVPGASADRRSSPPVAARGSGRRRLQLQRRRRPLMSSSNVDRLAKLRRLPLLASLSEAELAQMAERVEEKHFPPGAHLVEEGALGHSVFLITSGTCEVTRRVNGRPERLAQLGPGDFFGEMAVLSPDPRTATVTALGPVVAYSLSAFEFRTALLSSPAMAVHVMKVLAGRLRKAEAELAALRAKQQRG